MTEIIKYKRILFISLFCLFDLSIFAQSKDLSKVDWFSFGGGTGIKDHLSIFLSYTFLDENAFQINLNSDVKLLLFSESTNQLYSGSFSYGITDISKWFFGGAFIGPSILYKDYSESDKEFGVGVNLNAQYYFACSDAIGFGMDLYGNLNTIETIYGLRLSIFFKSY